MARVVCLCRLLMLLPQSSAFTALKTRLESVSALGTLHSPAQTQAFHYTEHCAGQLKCPESKFAVSTSVEKTVQETRQLDFKKLLGRALSLQREPPAMIIRLRNTSCPQGKWLWRMPLSCSACCVFLLHVLLWLCSPTQHVCLMHVARAIPGDTEASFRLQERRYNHGD